MSHGIDLERNQLKCQKQSKSGAASLPPRWRVPLAQPQKREQGYSERHCGRGEIPSGVVCVHTYVIRAVRSVERDPHRDSTHGGDGRESRHMTCAVHYKPFVVVCNGYTNGLHVEAMTYDNGRTFPGMGHTHRESVRVDGSATKGFTMWSVFISASRGGSPEPTVVAMIPREIRPPQLQLTVRKRSACACGSILWGASCVVSRMVCRGNRSVIRADSGRRPKNPRSLE